MQTMSSPTTPSSSAAGLAAARASGSRLGLAGALALLAVAAALAFLVKGYVLFQATMLLSYAIALVGLNLLTGYNGQISLGHGAFFAIGAYTVGVLMDKASAPYWLAVPAGGIVCLAVGYAFGRPALKLQGLYLALATFALGVVTPQLLKYKHLEQWTGGVGGIVLTKPEAPFGLPLTADQWFYLFTLVVAAVLMWLARNLIDSGTGRAIRAIRDHEMAAESMGVDNRHYKSMTFGFRRPSPASAVGCPRWRSSSCRPTRSPCSSPSPCWWAWSWAASARCGARHSARRSSCSCPTWRRRCPRTLHGASTASCSSCSSS